MTLNSVINNNNNNNNNNNANICIARLKQNSSGVIAVILRYFIEFG